MHLVAGIFFLYFIFIYILYYIYIQEIIILYEIWDIIILLLYNRSEGSSLPAAHKLQHGDNTEDIYTTMLDSIITFFSPHNHNVLY